MSIITHHFLSKNNLPFSIFGSLLIVSAEEFNPVTIKGFINIMTHTIQDMNKEKYKL